MIECPRCASRNDQADAFCGSCGMYLGWADRPAVVQPVAVAVAVAVETTAFPANAEYLPVAEHVEDTQGRVCAACARVNPWERRFCAHCGNRLIHGDDIVRETLSTPVVIAPWWQRIAFWRWPRGERVFPAGTRPDPHTPWALRSLPDLPFDAGPAARALHWVRRTLRRIWPDLLLALLLVVLLALLVPSVPRRIWNAVLDRTTPPRVAQPVSCTEPVKRANLLPAFPAAFVCDGKSTSAWASPVSSPSLSLPPQLIITLAAPPPTPPGSAPIAPGVDVDQVRITATASGQPPEYAAPDTGRPERVRLDFYVTNTIDGVRPRFSIEFPRAGKGVVGVADTDDTQSLTVPCLGAIRVVVITILGAYPDPTTHSKAQAQNVFLNQVAVIEPRSPCNGT